MSLINIGYSGAQAARIGMNITAMNIANAATPGYSRQRIAQQTIGPNGSARLFSGSGVEVTSVQRIADQFRISQVWRATTEVNYYDQGQAYLGSLETMIGSDTTGLGDGLDNFFKSLSGATGKPDNQAMRQDVLTEAKSMALRINNLQKFMQNQKTDIRQQQQDMVGNINDMNKSIANFNQKIREAEAIGGDTSSLRDQRDELVKSVSSFVDVRVSENSKGEFTLSLPTGQPLVSGSDASTLSMVPDANGEMQMSVNFAGSTYQADMSCGGKLGAIYDYLQQTLKPMETSLQGIAETMSNAFNDQLGKGFDLNGDPGKALFNFDASNPDGMLQVTDITWDELAFSAAKGEVGNNDNLLEMIKLKTQSYDIPGLGNTSIDNASASLISTIGIKSRQNQTELDSAISLVDSAQMQRDSYSQVDYDEEYVGLTTYMQAYNANMKVISTGDELFNNLLALF